MRKSVLLNAGLLCTSVFLAGCGGGGGGGSSSVSAASDVRAAPTYSISGTVEITDPLRADMDTADPGAPDDLRNNPPDPRDPPGLGWPQTLNENPVVVAGHSQRTGDRDDYYRLFLKTGQILRLTINEPAKADLDLYLYDVDGLGIIDGSLGSSSQEEIEILSDREYVINVSAYRGGSGYVLSVLNEVRASSLRQPTLRSDFVAGELLVKTDDSVQSASHSGEPRRRLQRRLLRGLREQSGKARQMDGTLRPRYETLLQLKKISSESGVRWAEPNFRVRASAVPDDPHFDRQWHLPLIELPSAWDMTVGKREGADVIVAVLDSGILSAHPDLEGQLVPGYDFVADASVSLDGDGIDPDPEDPGDQRENMDKLSSFHGTHVAGTIAAVSHNGLGVAGVAWQAKVMPVRVLGRDSSGTVYDVLQGVRYAAGLPNDSGELPSRRADIINLSLTGRESSSAAREVYAQARDAGVIIIAAGGNNGSSQLVYPAAYDTVTGVGAIGADKERLNYSSYGPMISLVGPGGQDYADRDHDNLPDLIYSTLGSLGPEQKKTAYSYGYKSGTSMSAAHVSGVVALMEAVDPNGDLTPREFENLLQSGELTQDLGSPGPDDYYGYGMIDAHRAVLAAAGGAPETPDTLQISPRSLDAGLQLDHLQFTLSNLGSGALTVESVSSDETWLQIQAPGQVGGLGTYTIEIDRQGLAPGHHSANITIESTAGSYYLLVTVMVPGAGLDEGRDAGTLHVYLLALDGEVQTVIREQLVSANAGSYSFRFDGVPGGRDYRIEVGTDHDNDGSICGVGEACAVGPELSDLSADQAGVQLVLEQN